jgi:hypothetical protein
VAKLPKKNVTPLMLFNRKILLYIFPVHFKGFKASFRIMPKSSGTKSFEPEFVWAGLELL